MACFVVWHRCCWKRRGFKLQGDCLLERLPDNFTRCCGFFLDLSASPPLFPRTVFLLHAFLAHSLHARKVSRLPVPSRSSPQSHICLEHPSSASATWLCPLVFATADGSITDKSDSMTLDAGLMLGGWHGAIPLEQMPGLCSAPPPPLKKANITS